ncbi:hypothetical protein PHAVU_009G203800 [Phaseolus vulgaris]|uniref:Uncharacterized protein n=1 Tax=Phaseolus vulgaris TaxID=3885 RepID=V7AYI5_PHAVU|nr:hypothetical protein PHAVU_009G203800g [Phaseolus vulgaris]ESW10375.1 hypothetical protein PHAVU_009G203800g [Phaseolus vulgaris]
MLGNHRWRGRQVPEPFLSTALLTEPYVDVTVHTAPSRQAVSLPLQRKGPAKRNLSVNHGGVRPNKPPPTLAKFHTVVRVRGLGALNEIPSLQTLRLLSSREFIHPLSVYGQLSLEHRFRFGLNGKSLCQSIFPGTISGNF